MIGGTSGASLFMFLMGIGLAYSKIKEHDLLKNGIFFFFAAYVLDFFRMFIWVIAEFVPSMKKIPDILYQCFEPDIYQFVGLVFIFFALVKKFKLSNLVIFIISIITLVIGNLVPTTLTGENILAGEFVSLFFWQNIYGSFSFFEWLIYPVAGLLFGLLLRRCLDKKRFYINLLICSLLIIEIIVGIAKLMNYNIHDNFYGNDSVYYLQTYPKVILNFTVIALTISICFFISNYLFPDCVNSFFSYISKLIAPIYVIHWLFVGNMRYFVTKDPGYMLYVYWILILTVSTLLAIAYKKVRKLMKSKLPQKQ